MKYVVLKDEITGEIEKLGRFRKDKNSVYIFTETYFSGIGWEEDETLYNQLLDGHLQEISEVEARRIIATQFSREKQAA
ncbi:MAG TPA: hypothetical protein PKE69_00300 [Pyrinomonadaceae bacterium]|nr:hypothetical protein [Pyrinomonadaceae bacterium]